MRRANKLAAGSLVAAIAASAALVIYAPPPAIRLPMAPRVGHAAPAGPRPIRPPHTAYSSADARPLTAAERPLASARASARTLAAPAVFPESGAIPTEPSSRKIDVTTPPIAGAPIEAMARGPAAIPAALTLRVPAASRGVTSGFATAARAIGVSFQKTGAAIARAFGGGRPGPGR